MRDQRHLAHPLHWLHHLVVPTACPLVASWDELAPMRLILLERPWCSHLCTVGSRVLLAWDEVGVYLQGISWGWGGAAG